MVVVGGGLRLSFFFLAVGFDFGMGCYLVGVSTGRSGSSLCPTRNRPAHIGWDVE